MRILLIAQSPEILTALKPLVTWGHRITVCPDLKTAATHSEKKSTDIVLADLKEIGAEIADWCRQRQLPLAVLTDGTNSVHGSLDQLPLLPDEAHLQVFVNKTAPKVEGIPLQYEQAMVICDEDEELLREIVEVFLSDAPNHVEGIRAGLKAGDLEQVRRSAHAIKGASGNIAAESLREAAQHLERSAKGGDPKRARAAFLQCQYEFLRLKKYLSREWGL
jgi:HPt (histidine-containing phosphotransfer) domain-containing protein